MEKEMWKLVTDEISRAWKTEEDSACRKGARLSSVISFSELPPGNCPCAAHAEQGKRKDSNLHSWSIMWSLPGTGTDAGAEHFSLLWCAGHIWRQSSVEGSQLRGEIRLRSLLSTDSWRGLSLNSWATEKELRWRWNICYSCNSGSASGHREEKASLTNSFTEVLNSRQARIQSV